MTMQSRLTELEARTGIGEVAYSWPSTLDVRRLSPAQEAAAIAEVERRQEAEGKIFKNVNIVLISTCYKI